MINMKKKQKKNNRCLLINLNLNLNLKENINKRKKPSSNRTNHKKIINEYTWPRKDHGISKESIGYYRHQYLLIDEWRWPEKQTNN
jgi:hypothetical protein